MEKEVMNISKQGITEVIKNTNINMNLSDWPAAAVLISACISSVAICGIKTFAEIATKEVA